MTEREASRTALGTAYLRAAHQILDAKPLIFEDPMALRLLGDEASQKILDSLGSHQSPAAKALRSHVVLRSRFTEDRLQEAVSRGVTRYILLGAGFDTFALRQPDWARALKIIEVDHPGTQKMKQWQMTKGRIDVPSNLSFVHVDFEHESLLAGLMRQGISPEEPTFFSWLGVTMYLNDAAIDATLKSVAAFSAGSEIVLTFMGKPDSVLDSADAELAERVSTLGEPFISFFEPAEIETKLRQAGFTDVTFLSPGEATERYYEGRAPDLPAPSKIRIVCAMRG